MLRDHERIAREMADPALVRLHRKLERLSSVLTVMNTGAHPDDEASGMLAALRFGLGMRIVIACSTRGEGGQNAIGPERGAALGVLRTREMEVAARALDADVIWLGHGPDDPVYDFGFSKDGDDTLARWGEDRIVERLVRAYREERPDIVIPTFLDVPGQHGHHRAMTRAAVMAFERAADPTAYPHHFAEGLRPWRISKLYLPAWSGGGGTYDDEVPPPSMTLLVEVPGHDAATGAAFARIGEWSRAGHRSQGMGVWLDAPSHSWPLHLLKYATKPGGDEADIRDGLAATVGELAETEGLSQKDANKLIDAQEAIDEARTAFPHRQRIVDAAVNAARSIEHVLTDCPHSIAHKLERKLRELDAVLLDASRVQARAWVEPTIVAPGSTANLHVAIEAPSGTVSIKPILPPAISMTGGRQWDSGAEFELSVKANAPFTNPYPSHFRSLGSNGEGALEIEATIGGRKAQAFLDLEEPLLIAPECSLILEPNAVIVNLTEGPRSFMIKAHLEEGDLKTRITLSSPPDWTTTPARSEILVHTPDNIKPDLYRLEAFVNDHLAYRMTPISYPHIGRVSYQSREMLSILALDISRHPQARIGYIGGGNDRVGLWLRRLGYDVIDLDADILPRDLSRFTTIVVGIFAFGTRPDLAAAKSRLHRFVNQGGHLVTLYHRPSDGWDPETTPPQRIEIGSPSLRWRVADPQAPVTAINSEHPLLVGPNLIGPDDWAGWDKERGLYFASRWSDAYAPLVAMSDKGEPPLLGGLISGQIGQGRHTHVSLALHHQLDKLVPGAFRLIANLVQPA